MITYFALELGRFYHHRQCRFIFINLLLVLRFLLLNSFYKTGAVQTILRTLHLYFLPAF